MAVTNTFLIFLKLKCQEVWPWALGIMASIGGIIGLCICSASENVWLCFIPSYLLMILWILYTIIVGGMLLVGLPVLTFRWLRDNWRKAKKISAERKERKAQLEG